MSTQHREQSISAFRVVDENEKARVRADLRSVITRQLGFGYTNISGDTFDDVLVKNLAENLLQGGADGGKAAGSYCASATNGETTSMRFCLVSAEQWARDYPDMKDAVSRQQANEHGAIEIPEGVKPRFADRQVDLLVVRQPNGSQRWPDVLIIAGGVGFPIEIKASRQDKIVWNSGLPRAKSLYIFNCAQGARQGQTTTVFLGNDIMDADNLSQLRAAQEAAQSAVSPINDAIVRDHRKRWEGSGLPERAWPKPILYYPRAMHNHNERFFASQHVREMREHRALDHILTRAFLRTGEKPVSPQVAMRMAAGTASPAEPVASAPADACSAPVVPPVAGGSQRVVSLRTLRAIPMG